MSGVRVLILDDSPEDAELVNHAALRALPEAVVRRVSGRGEYDAALVAFVPDLVLSDFRLPDMDGLEAVRMAVAAAARPAVVVVTGSMSEEVAVECMKAGASDYVLKDRLERLGLALQRALEVRQVRREREVAEDRLRLVAESIPDRVAIVEPDGAISYANPAQAHQAGGAGAAWLVGVHADDRARVEGALREGLAHGESWTLEHRAAEGGAVLETRGVPALETGQVVRTVIVSRDLTARRAAEAALRQSQEHLRQAQKLDAIGRLAGGVAHDFNNMLTAIRGFADLLLLGLPPAGPQRGHALQIQRAADRAAALTSQLMLFSRRQAERATDVDVGALLRGTAPMLARLIGEDMRLDVQAPPGCFVHADRVGLEQVVLNLAVNARAAMPSGGRLELAVRRVHLEAPARAARGEAPPGHWVELRATDSGRGMDEATLERLFEPFFTTKGPGEGTGLGLLTVLDVVTRCNGHILVDSHPGEGTNFRLLLPPAAKAGPATPSLPVALRPGGAETVLVVEDDAVVRGLAREVLAGLGYTLLMASSGPDALALARDHPGSIDLLLTDVVMPHMSGPQLATHLTSSRPGLRVLFMSGYAPEHTWPGGPPDNLLEKPFSTLALAQRVREVLDATSSPSG